MMAPPSTAAGARRRRVTLVILALVCHCNGVAQAHPQTAYVEGEVIVTFKPAVSQSGARQVLDGHALGFDRRFADFSKWRGRETGLVHSTNRTTVALITELSGNPSVETVEPNYLRWVSTPAPNDTLFTNLWGLRNTGQTVQSTTGTAGSDISFVPAWALARSSSTNPPVVAIIDTGADYTHKDLTNNIWINSGEIAGNNIDDDGNGYVDDWHGYNFADGTSDISDSGEHGTHVAGTIAATGNNSLGVIGVNYLARVMPLRASSDGSTLSDSAIISAIQYATKMKNLGVNVVAINASFGGGGSNSTERAAIVAAGNAGIVFCAAAGNETNNNDRSLTYPASYHLTNMIVVAATDSSDALAYFSNYGTNTVDIAAPGLYILSTVPVAYGVKQTSVQQGSTNYTAYEVEYSGTTTGLTAGVYYCGLGYSTNFPKAVSNNIALIQRGTLTFSNKVYNAQKAGALAAIIYNNTDGDFSGFTLGSSNSWIPAVAVSQTNGQAIQTNASATLINQPDSNNAYAYLSGTSMATPHVAGAVAFAALNFPSETSTQRVQRVLANADVIAGLKSKVNKGRRLNLRRIVDTDTNSLPDWWELQYFGQLTGVNTNADTDHDGLSNLGEWLAGTNPTNAASGLWLTLHSSAAANTAVLSWPSVAGKTYRIARATNLVTGFDSFVRTNITATAPTNSETDSATLPGNARFYRIGVEP